MCPSVKDTRRLNHTKSPLHTVSDKLFPQPPPVHLSDVSPHLPPLITENATLTTFFVQQMQNDVVQVEQCCFAFIRSKRHRFGDGV